tara:strand:- start:125 stop:322 length:198 start_codon:yes stop_codon:yes gene_type:complete
MKDTQSNTNPSKDFFFKDEDTRKVLNEFMEAVEDYKSGSIDLTSFVTKCMVAAEDADNYGLKDWE